MANTKIYRTNAWFEKWGGKVIVNIEAMNRKEAVEIASVIPGLAVRDRAIRINKDCYSYRSKEHQINKLKFIFNMCEVFLED